MSARATGLDRTALALLFGCVFLSGAAALTYETVWTRSFAIILGSTVHSASATFAAFLVGLAGGAWVFGRRITDARRIVHAYIAVEIAIALLAPGVGLLIHRNADALAVFVGAEPGGKAFVAFGTVLLTIWLPTLFMGATFPLMLTVARRLGAPVTAIGRLYGINTLGAALGTLLCGFVLIRVLGVTQALAVGALANLAAAVCCLPLLRRPLRVEDEAPDEAQGSAEVETREQLPEWALLLVAATSGALILGLEVVWARFAGYFLGNRTYAFTTLLACVLVLLAVGSWLSGPLVARYGRRPRELFGWTLLAGALAATLSASASWWWIGVQGRVEPLLPGAADLVLLYRALETFLLLVLPLVTLGCLFPASLMCARRTARATGEAAGRFYVANTAGSVTGSLGVGFFGVSAFGAFGSVAVLALVAVLAACVVFAVDVGRDESLRDRSRGWVSALLVLLALPFLLPARLGIVRDDEELLFRTEDEYGVMQVVRMEGGPLRVTNNRTELIYHLGLVATSFVQEMQGHLGVFHHPDAKTAAVIGSGYGITAGAVALHPSIDRVVAVEIIPGMVEAAPLFEPFHHGYHRDPRVEVVVADGRHYLAASEQRFDIVSVNVSDPHLPGGSSLFHADFYAMLKERLAPGGVVVQHAFGSGTEVILRTLLESFEDVRLYPAYGNGYNVVAADRSLDVPTERVDALLEVPRVRGALEAIGVLPPVTASGLLAAGLRREAIEPWMRGRGVVATDDRPVLEFAWSSGRDLLFSNE